MGMRIASLAFISFAFFGAWPLGSARAQEMIFTEEDVDQPVSSAGAEGSPSAALANGLRLYQGDHYLEAAVQLQRVVEGTTNDAAGNVEKATFFLAKTLCRLHFDRAALSVFDAITQAGPSHRYFESSLPWLADLATRMPAPAGVTELVGRYPDAMLARLDRDEMREVHDHVRYLMGRYAYGEGDLERAITHFSQVTSGSPHHARARFFMGVAHVRMRHASPAIEAFRSVIAAVDRGETDDPVRMRSLAWLSLGRVYYTAANQTDPNGDRHLDPHLLENAIDAWSRVEMESEYWLDALFEQSWAYFLGSQENRSMGNIHALTSPYFADAYYPEALVLKAVVFFSACQEDNTRALIEQFHERYDPIHGELNATLASMEDNDAFYRYLTEVRADQAQLHPALRAPVANALGDRTLLQHLDTIRQLDQESERLEQTPSAFRDSPLGDRIRQEVALARSFLVDRTGDLARARFARLIEELDELMIQIDTVEVELLRMQHGGLVEGRTVPPEERGGFEVEVDDEHQIWPFDGEYWRDELPFYRQRISSRCSR